MSARAFHVPAAVTLLLAAIAGCSPRAPYSSSTSDTSASEGSPGPWITRLAPDTVNIAGGALARVTIHGRGFAAGTPGRNTVTIGTFAMKQVPASAAGDEIILTVPESIPSGGEAPPQPLEAGRYEIRVAVGPATSNALWLTVKR